MRKLIYSITGISMMLLVASCTKDKTAEPQTSDVVGADVLAMVKKQGFSDENVTRAEGGYIVEGDIFLSDNELTAPANWGTLEIANVEQYRTTNLVSVNGTRTITLSLKSGLPSSYVAAVDEVVNRYNDLNLTIKFQRVSSGGNIEFSKAPRGAGYLASAGFPTSNGTPYGSVKVNSGYLGNNPGTSYLATILAHEVGHCIGFRHTDYMDRSYSCGGSPYNEGASSVGAILIPGTPSGPDANSWMLSCIGSGVNRPFNNNDKTALNYLY
ncbi:M57 family metalloprotease [Pollutibacter soli]|uniref:M57 family metalloprotease n=1 Tax=Pollutibacter soli TaxID=3034157 RepID=UPI00301415F2